MLDTEQEKKDQEFLKFEAILSEKTLKKLREIKGTPEDEKVLEKLRFGQLPRKKADTKLKVV